MEVDSGNDWSDYWEQDDEMKEERTKDTTFTWTRKDFVFAMWRSF